MKLYWQLLNKPRSTDSQVFGATEIQASFCIIVQNSSDMEPGSYMYSAGVNHRLFL